MPFVRLTPNQPDLPQETTDTLAKTITGLLVKISARSRASRCLTSICSPSSPGTSAPRR